MTLTISEKDISPTIPPEEEPSHGAGANKTLKRVLMTR